MRCIYEFKFFDQEDKDEVVLFDADMDVAENVNETDVTENVDVDEKSTDPYTFPNRWPHQLVVSIERFCTVYYRIAI